ncbi:Uncharacterized protein BP5553_06696 [Venustampulla echinocandica]|uniref:Altered inheritance of mitochondria protein 11 n=1 Tax=Venustampulla echinocandica TaxID=2656787 RepID=A0A370TKN7_9HELO|nr:Uncharacterized protein BP5553_06696 [Venustampulla echinocandica]RDL36084.1 Uncharacterized protein BP5553_06696 [Venustampulla echinocandica]
MAGQPFTPTSTSTSTSNGPFASRSEYWRDAVFGKRSRRQLGLFAAGLGFFALSTVITRRSLIRRHKASIPRFYQPSNRANYDFNGGMEAFEALNIATINVFSVGMMTTGGLLWAFDIASLSDMQAMVRSKMFAEGSAEDKAAEKDIEQWFVNAFDRKEFKHLLEGRDPAEVAKELAKDAAEKKDASEKKTGEGEEKS